MSTTATAASQAMNTLNIVATQVQNLLNVHVTKYVNTGDRVVDNGVTLIVNSCIALVGAYLYSAIIKITNWIYDCYVIRRKPETDDPTDIDIAGFDYSQWTFDTITNYSYACCIPVDQRYTGQLKAAHVDNWLNNKFKTRHSVKQTDLITERGSIIVAASTTSSTISVIAGYFMPVWKYKNQTGSWDYVWLHNSTLYSNDYAAINACTCAIYKYINECAALAIAKLAAAPDAPKIFDIFDINHGGNNAYRVGSMNPKKKFDGLFYDKKDELIHVLDKFMAGTMYPQSMCDNKLGILLYGPPGTGKTGTITALANYTQRNVFMVKQTTKNDLDILKNVIKSHGLRNMIIVFDEFDHIMCGKKTTNYSAEYMKDLKIKSLREDLNDLAEDDKDGRNAIKQQIKELKDAPTTDKNDDIEMGDLLRFLDGVEDQTGRLIIATTNHPDKINPLLLRPGRFDLKLELGYCSMQMFRDIARNVFADDIDHLADMVHTQTIRAVATAEVATTDKPTSDTPAVEITQTITTPMEEYIAQLLKKKITPLNLINSCLKAKSFTELITHMEALAPDTFTYSTK